MVAAGVARDHRIKRSKFACIGGRRLTDRVDGDLFSVLAEHDKSRVKGLLKIPCREGFNLGYCALTELTGIYYTAPQKSFVDLVGHSLDF